MSITQQEYNNLLRLQKEFQEHDTIILGPHPIKWSKTIKALETHDLFILDFTRNSTIKISKYQINKRYRSTIVLFRYCSDKPHTNPDGKKFVGSHIHIYQEGYDDKIACDPKDIGIETQNSMEEVLIKILNYFNVINIPNIQKAMN